MPLSAALVRSAQLGDKAAAKVSDSDEMYLLVTARGKCWRFDYRYLGKRKTLALGAYPEVSLSKARTRALDARTLLADGIDPGDEKRKAKQAKLVRNAQPFEQVAGLWLETSSSSRAATTQDKVHGYLKRDVFPEDLGELTEKVTKELKLVPEGITDETKGADSIRLILRNLTQLTNNLAQLRGLYGTGHGRDGQHRGLQPRHAQLAVASAIAFVDFIVATYRQRENQLE